MVGDIFAAAISPDTPKLLFSRKEAAYSLGLSLRSIAILLKNGELLATRCGNQSPNTTSGASPVLEARPQPRLAIPHPNTLLTQPSPH
jgi:hypothetical protein